MPPQSSQDNIPPSQPWEQNTPEHEHVPVRPIAPHVEQPYQSVTPPAPHQPQPVPSGLFSQDIPRGTHAPQPSTNVDDPVTPMPVVQVLSPRGVEYVMLTIALFTAAIGLTSALLCLVNGQTSLMSLSLPAALLLVGLPVFAALFLRLKRAELKNPSLKLDQSKRRSTQTTQIISFLVSILTLVGLIVTIFAAIGGETESIGKAIASALIVFVIFTGILAYYWWDEHRA